MSSFNQEKATMKLIYKGKKIVLNPCFSTRSIYESLSKEFGFNLNAVENFTISKIDEDLVLPLNSTNSNLNGTFDLIVNYKIIEPPINDNQLNESLSLSSNMQDNEYFNGYANLAIHRTMLQDKIRTGFYKKGIEECKERIKDKIVLDVGTGTGVLSIFAARCGARRVYSVDASLIAKDASLVIASNGLSDIITVYESKIEEISLPSSKVDVIVSEWMGSMLLFESMLVSVINARDRFLKDNGLMLPSSCSMLLAPLDITDFVESHVGFWGDVHGINMSVLKERARMEFFSSAIFTRTVKASELIASEKSIFSFNMHTVKEPDIENLLSTFSFEIERKGKLHGFCCWFDALFKNTVLSTSPEKPETHWKQTMFVFDKYPDVEKGDKIEGIISVTRSYLWGRHYEVVIKYKFSNDSGWFQKKFPLPTAPQ